MATFIWQAGGAGDATNTASWDQGSLPTTGSDIIFPANTTQAVTTWLASSIAFGSITFVEGSVVDFMSSGSPGQLGAGWIDIRGRGNIYIQQHNGGGSVSIDRTMVRPSKSDAVVQLTSSTGDASGYGPIHVASGVVTIDTNSGTFALVEVGRRGASGDAVVTINSGSGALTTLRAMSGRVTTYNAITTAEVDPGGVLTHGGVAAVTNLHVRGRAFYNSNQNITLCEVYPGGYYDSTGVGHGITVTTLVRWPLSTVKKLSTDIQPVTNDYNFTE